jgi:photosystem II stability/assembly factor-like uncharacterized protein
MPPGAEKLDFRGIWAWDWSTAVVMSSGTGELSRLYKTTDGCSSWKLLYTNPDKDGFWDAVAFSDRNIGLILGDPFLRPQNGESVSNLGQKQEDRFFGLFSTTNGGLSWVPFAHYALQAPPDAAVFAASNSALAITPSITTFSFGIGGKGRPSNYRLIGKPIPPGASTSITELEWVKSPVPLASGNESSGVFSLAFRDKDHGIAVGGDYKKPDESTGTAAYTSDGGKTWTAAAKPPHGYRSAVAWDAADKAWIAAGTNGSDVSFDDGKSWSYLDSRKWNALSLPWVVGPEGRIGKLVSLKVAGSESGKK